MIVYVAGHIIKEGTDASEWDILGVFDTEELAVDACYDERCFVGPLTLNHVLPRELILWPGAYYPKRQSEMEEL